MEVNNEYQTSYQEAQKERLKKIIMNIKCQRTTSGLAKAGQ
jgi:hypothetical protein